MQRKIFYAAGQPLLATRGDGFFETAGTLQRLIKDGLQQQRDLMTWQQAASPTVVSGKAEARSGVEEAVAPSLEVEPLEVAVAEPVMVDVPTLVERQVPAKRERRRRQTAKAPDPSPLLAPQRVPLAEPRPLPVAEAGKLAGTAAMLPSEPGKRWLVAGAARRGRAGKHWSTRQR